MIEQFKFLPIGQRLIRSVLAVFICLLMYEVRGEDGTQFYSILAALLCVQNYRRNTIEVGVTRMQGTLIGAFWGLLLIIMGVNFFPAILSNNIISYTFISIFTGIVIYSTVLIGLKDLAYFACTVFLSIAIMHADNGAPYLHVASRVIDTLIGVMVALFVDSIHLPRGTRNDILFVTDLDNLILDENGGLSDFNKIELNRMLDEGMKFSISTYRTPANLRENLQELNITLPCIVMDGGAIYDMGKNEYLETIPIKYKDSVDIIKALEEIGINYFTTVVIENTLVIYYSNLENFAEKDLYNRMKTSPYRNYINRAKSDHDDVLYFMFIGRSYKVENNYIKLCELFGKRFLIKKEKSEYEGFTMVRIYNKNATSKNMLVHLKNILNMEKSIVYSHIPNEGDVFIEKNDRYNVVRRIKKEYKPVKLGKNIFYWKGDKK
ncbi:MAG: HAD hydrolase family protein [Lachnospirales bacterium]